MAKQIKISELTAQVEEGWKIEKLAEFYELPINTTRNLLRQAGLTIKKLKRPLFELVDDTVETVKDPKQLDLFQTIQESENTLETVVTPSEPIIVKSDVPELIAFEAEKQVTPPSLLDDALDQGIPEDVLAEMNAVLAQDVHFDEENAVVDSTGSDWDLD